MADSLVRAEDKRKVRVDLVAEMISLFRDKETRTKIFKRELKGRQGQIGYEELKEWQKHWLIRVIRPLCHDEVSCMKRLVR